MGESKHDGLAIPGRVVLAHEPAFTVGVLRVQPALRDVSVGRRSEIVEPRVMQALVALASTQGQIVTRDELIERCWDGRIVSDDAINRVLSRIRQIAREIGAGSFTVETIARVGYRLKDAGAPQAQTVLEVPAVDGALAATSRRALIIGTAATVAAVSASGLVLLRPWQHRPNAEAEQFYARGGLLMREGLPGQVRQAVSYFERAVAIDPQYAAAWGALALAYSHRLEGFDQAEMGSLPTRIRSAAGRALELDSGNADAKLAVIFIKPYFRNWASMEEDLRRIIDEHPDHWLAHGRLGVLLYQVGRLSDGIEQNRMALEIEPMLPISYFFIIANLSALGRAQEAEALIETAHARWPAHPALWMAKFQHLLFSGRPKSAAAFAMDPDSLPSAFAPSDVDPLLRLARALYTRDSVDIEASIEDQQRQAVSDVTAIPFAATVFALLGRPDLTFASLERYFFNRGDFAGPSQIGRETRRYTNALFTQPMSAVRDDPRFAAQLEAIGLEDYWRRTGTVPDYRKRS